MDTSPEYVKMCDCPGIQGQRANYTDYIDGDCVYDGSLGCLGYHCDACDAEAGVPLDITCIWLPRQDQLQEMVGGGVRKMADMVYWWVECVTDLGDLEPTSMEQLWLALVMHHKHNKTWTGETWV